MMNCFIVFWLRVWKGWKINRHSRSLLWVNMNRRGANQIWNTLRPNVIVWYMNLIFSFFDINFMISSQVFRCIRFICVFSHILLSLSISRSLPVYGASIHLKFIYLTLNTAWYGYIVIINFVCLLWCDQFEKPSRSRCDPNNAKYPKSSLSAIKRDFFPFHLSYSPSALQLEVFAHFVPSISETNPTVNIHFLFLALSLSHSLIVFMLLL